MDVNGAKALKRRLGPNGEVEPKPARADVDLPEGAPPVYQWLGLSRPALDAGPVGEGDHQDRPVAALSLFRRLGLSFR